MSNLTIEEAKEIAQNIIARIESLDVFQFSQEIREVGSEDAVIDYSITLKGTAAVRGRGSRARDGKVTQSATRAPQSTLE